MQSGCREAVMPGALRMRQMTAGQQDAMGPNQARRNRTVCDAPENHQSDDSTIKRMITTGLPEIRSVIQQRLPACLRLRVPVENADLDRLSLERRRKLLRFLTLEVVRDGDLGFEPLGAFGCLGRSPRVWPIHW